MSLINAPFGFRSAFGKTGQPRVSMHTIASGYGTAIYKGMPVTLDPNGTIIAAVAASDILGIMAGVEYIDGTGRPVYSPSWPAGQTVMAGTKPRVFLFGELDQQVVFEVQATGPIQQTDIGSQADVANVNAGSASTGHSACGLGAPVASGAQGQFRILEVSPYVDNAVGDPFTIVRVSIARNQFFANKVAI